MQSNFGAREQMLIAGVPVGKEITVLMPIGDSEAAGNSIIVVVATDAPLLPGQLKRVARRPALALGRLGSIGNDKSGDFFLGFSTGNRVRIGDDQDVSIGSVQDIDPIFAAVVWATEEAIVNALVAAKDMKGVDDHVVYAIPHDRLQAVPSRYNRLDDVPSCRDDR